MKCQIQWIDSKTGKPTPDANDAVMMAHAHKMVTPLSLRQRVQYTDEIAESFPICAKHYAQVKWSDRYEYGGGWSFSLPFTETK